MVEPTRSLLSPPTSTFTSRCQYCTPPPPLAQSLPQPRRSSPRCGMRALTSSRTSRGKQCGAIAPFKSADHNQAEALNQPASCDLVACLHALHLWTVVRDEIRNIQEAFVEVLANALEVLVFSRRATRVSGVRGAGGAGRCGRRWRCRKVTLARPSRLKVPSSDSSCWRSSKFACFCQRRAGPRAATSEALRALACHAHSHNASRLSTRFHKTKKSEPSVCFA